MGFETTTVVMAGVLAAVVFVLGRQLRRVGLHALLGGAAGLLFGLLCAFLVARTLPADTPLFTTMAALLALAYLGIVVGAAQGGAWRAGGSAVAVEGNAAHLLDTSVIIDGRIADIVATGFLGPVLVIPQFVLHELQLVADSADGSKRNRGRRGLDILKKLQGQAGLEVRIEERDYEAIREVDDKLIELAKATGAKIVTNDFNLNKVAQLHGVAVLNINELANALKPVVLPGETMKVFIQKEGKEPQQGVAYLDDGTMVVVDNARRQIAKTLDITVTSVLQTTAGKMIFGRYDDRG